MVKVFRCRDTGSNCDFVGRGATPEETVSLSVKHIYEVHGMALGRELEAHVQRALRAE